MGTLILRLLPVSLLARGIARGIWGFLPLAANLLFGDKPCAEAQQVGFVFPRLSTKETSGIVW